MALEIRKRKSGTIYRVTPYLNGQRMPSKSFPRKHDAMKWLEQKEEQFRVGITTKMKFGDAVAMWRELYASHKLNDSTRFMWELRLSKAILPFFGRMFLEDISPETIDRFIVYVKKLPGVRTNSTINDYLKILSAILGFLVKRRYLTNNPTRSIEHLPQETLTINYLSFEEKERFLEYTDWKYYQEQRWVYVAYLTLLTTGLRWGEFSALQWDRVDLANRIITVSRTYCVANDTIRNQTKSGHIRYVGINSTLHPELAGLYGRRGERTTLVFHNRNGSVLNPQNFKRDCFAKDLREAGLQHFRIHDLRHTFASHYVMLGGDMYKLQALLGHGSVRMTQRYAHLSPSSVVNETELLATSRKISPPFHPQGEFDNKKALNFFS